VPDRANDQTNQVRAKAFSFTSPEVTAQNANRLQPRSVRRLISRSKLPICG
jgi:hypothetical protein